MVDLLQIRTLANLRGVMKNLARRIKREFGVKTGKRVHCAVYEDELQRIWPPTEKDRRTKIAQFASNYGFD